MRKKTDVSADVINSVKQYNTIRSGEQAPVTCESSDSIVSEQYLHAGVKNMVEKFESPQRGSVTYSGKQTPIGESVSSDDSGLDLESTFDTSFCSEINNDGAANEVDDQTSESLQPQIQLQDRQIRKLEKPGKELKHVEKALEKLKSDLAEHETRLEILDKLSKENQSLKQKIKNLENENTTLNSELSKTKANKVEKTQLCFLKIASVNLVTMLTVGVIFSVAFQLPILLMIATSVTSALIASVVTYTISTKPTELKEVSIQCSMQHDACKT